MRKTNIKVSVIVPVYNVAPYLAQCLDSLVGQSLSDIEIICVDDKSTDESLEILHQYRDKYPQITVIELDKNSGVSTARNTGMNAACGEYLGFVDSDDYVDLDFYEKLYNTARATGADITCGDTEVINTDGTTGDGGNMLYHIEKYGKWRFASHWWSAIYTAKMLQEHKICFNTDIISGQDSVFQAQSVSVANKIAISRDVKYHYVHRNGSLDSPRLSTRKIVARIKTYTQICQTYNQSQFPDISEYNLCYARAMSNLYWMIFRAESNDCIPDIADAIIDLYAKCKNVAGIAGTVNRWGYNALEYIIEQDRASLAAAFESAAREYHAPRVATRTSRTYTIMLMGWIPIMQIRRGGKHSFVKIFGLSVLKCKRVHKNIRITFLYIPIARIKIK